MGQFVAKILGSTEEVWGECHGQSETPHLGQLKSPHPLTMEVEDGEGI
jgi:hypothetical protein